MAPVIGTKARRHARGWRVPTALAVGLVLINLLIGINTRVHAQNLVRYAHPTGNCGGFTPCYSSLRQALDAAQAGDTILAQGSFTESLTGTAPARITLQGVGGVRITGELNMYLLDGWTIRDLAFTGMITVHDPTTALTITNNHAEAIYIFGTLDLDLALDISDNTLPGVFDFPRRNSEISILGGDGHALRGRYSITRNQGIGALNIFTYVRENGNAALDAEILVQDNVIVDSANLGITRRDQNRGTGQINGRITFERNTVQTPIKGLNVTVDGEGTSGDINGTMVFRDNLADKLAVITIDSLGGAMRGDFIAIGNRGERIEFGIKGDCTSRTVQIEKNQLTWKGSPEDTVITVRANTFSAETSIRVADNTAPRGKNDGFGIVVMTYTGANNAYTQIDHNQTFFIVYQVARASTAGVIITNNTVQPGDPLKTPYDGALSVLIGEGDLHRATISGNHTRDLRIEIATRLLDLLTLSQNVVTGDFTLKVSGILGPGTAELRGNRFEGAIQLARTNITARFNQLVGTKINIQNGGSLDARNNWWGCNDATTCRMPISTTTGQWLITEPYLILTPDFRCTASDQKVVLLAHILQNNLGEVPPESEVDAEVSVKVGEQGNILHLERGWGSLSVPPRKPVTLRFDRQQFTSESKTCPKRPETIGVYRPSEGRFYLQTGETVTGINFDSPNLLPVAGDWDGTGADSIGVFDGQAFRLRRNDGTTQAFIFGGMGDLPLAGRWDAAMTHDGVGVLRVATGVIHLRRELAAGTPDYVIVLGAPGDLPLVGDWDGDGIDGIGIFHAGQFLLVNRADVQGAVKPDLSFSFGNGGDRPFAGDWKASGASQIGLFRNGTFFIRDGDAVREIQFGIPGDWPLAGRWASP